MSTPATEVVAVACVVESSLILASEWSRVLVDYVFPLLKRLGEAHTVGHQMSFRMGFVTYAIADTRPTPLLEKRFFVPVQPLTKELREEPSKLGIGQTGSGGSRGMAALEGLVAAIELFDTLRASIEMKSSQAQSLSQPRDTQHLTPRLVSHILHIAASKADEAQRPLWNNSMDLDDVSWQTLPAELNKRNINLSVINLRPNSQFSELHSSAATKGVTPPWFKVKSPHTLFLTGFPPEPKVTKRPAENHSSPDSKRAKVSQTSSEPSPNFTNSSPALTSSTPTMAPQPPPPANSPNSAQPPRTGQPSEQAIHAGLRNLEAEIHKLNNQFNAAKEQGHTDLVAQVKKNLDAKLDMVKLFKQTVNDHQRSVQQARSNPQGPPILPGNIQTPPLSQMPSANPDSLDVPRGLPNRNGGPSLLPGAASQEATVTPEMAGQAQKPMDNPGARPSQPAALQQVQPTQQNPAPTMPTSTPVQQQRPSFKTYWEGSLAWVGFNATTRDRKELHAQVRVTCVNGDIIPDTWPKSLTLTPSRESVTLPGLQVWVRRTKAQLCTISPYATSLDQQSNDRNFRSLLDLLAQKRLYALAAWNVPSGAQPTNNFLIFTMTNGLVGAAFPTSGIPEMPKPPLDFAAQLQKLTPEQQLVLAQMTRQKQREQQQQQLLRQQQLLQHQHQPGLYDQGGLNVPGHFVPPANLQDKFQTNSIHSMDVFGTSQSGSSGVGASIMPVMGPQSVSLGGGLHRRTPSDNSLMQASSVSIEMLQSFMQRNADGSGGAGMA